MPIGELAKTGPAQKLQATTKGGGLFSIELPSLAARTRIFVQGRQNL